MPVTSLGRRALERWSEAGKFTNATARSGRRSARRESTEADARELPILLVHSRVALVHAVPGRVGHLDRAERALDLASEEDGDLRRSRAERGVPLGHEALGQRVGTNQRRPRPEAEDDEATQDRPRAKHDAQILSHLSRDPAASRVHVFDITVRAHVHWLRCWPGVRWSCSR
jgi:hypothetical protein